MNLVEHNRPSVENYLVNVNKKREFVRKTVYHGP
jgi:hypothetical protein